MLVYFSLSLLGAQIYQHGNRDDSSTSKWHHHFFNALFNHVKCNLWFCFICFIFEKWNNPSPSKKEEEEEDEEEDTNKAAYLESIFIAQSVDHFLTIHHISLHLLPYMILSSTCHKNGILRYYFGMYSIDVKLYYLIIECFLLSPEASNKERNVHLTFISYNLI